MKFCARRETTITLGADGKIEEGEPIYFVLDNSNNIFLVSNYGKAIGMLKLLKNISDAEDASELEGFEKEINDSKIFEEIKLELIEFISKVLDVKRSELEIPPPATKQ